MANSDEHEWRIIGVTGSLHLKPPRKSVLLPKADRLPPTREGVLERMRSVKGAASVIERISTLGDIVTWDETAFWSGNQPKGAASHKACSDAGRI